MSTTTVSNILGISAYYHDSAAALLRNGKLVAAALRRSRSPERTRSLISSGHAVVLRSDKETRYAPSGGFRDGLQRGSHRIDGHTLQAVYS